MLPKIYKILMSFDDRPVLVEAGAIEVEGSLWLVPEWLGTPATGPQRPERMIRPNPAHVQSPPPGFQVD